MLGLLGADACKVPAIAKHFCFLARRVRSIIKEFNECRLDALKPEYRGGRPEKFSEEHKSLVIEKSLCPLDSLGRPFKRWSLAKLRGYLVEEEVTDSISLETLQQILRKQKVRLRRAKTWNKCTDPRLKTKRN